MHETDADLRALQELLDASHANAGPHLRSIFSDERRIPAAELPALLPGVQARFRHIRARPAVSATHLRGEELAVVVHGRAVEIDPRGAGEEGFRAYLNETYSGWDDADWARGAPYARIEPSAMFTFRSAA
jgi:hypothetical protein